MYKARHTLRGKHVYYAVDSVGDVVKWTTIRPNDPPAETLEWLFSVLDAMDPVAAPHLKLVRTG